ncbi:NAD+ synthase [Caldisericum exile]|uniref:NH(3)-dependent NAD(+) synthetase n=1 Tax=Caldisericum exile (strain DSM 21853 / NBRC 104410 / AZM16c01) TaxID=511051 RepID=A0A7U6GES0_CALEA|nr:NAD+ synthase [Caldisericum exile]BAL81054.1 NH(3)-dependent NAD(+) synthetase [Caldisericum exile AZM16c01]
MIDLSLNYELTKKFIVKFIQEELKSNNFEHALIGISGGIDSALVAYLAVEALGKENVFGVLLPYKLSSKESIEDGLKVVKDLGIEHEVIEITDIADCYFEREKIQDKFRIGNFLARIRMSIIFDKAREFDSIVLGTSNKSEILLGYTTWYGDMAAGIYPIGDLYKTQVFGLSKYIGVPESILNKKPSADLWPGQTDEDEIGTPYSEIDQILYLYLEERKTKDEIMEMGFKKEHVENVLNRMFSTQFKRTLPPVCKISLRTFGHDFLYPHDVFK